MKTMTKLLCISFMFFALPQVVEGASTYGHTSDNQQDMLYVITGPSGTLDGDLLTINSVPQVIYFSNGIEKQAGQVSLQEFIDNWDAVAAVEGSKATLVINGYQGPEQVTVLLSEPKVANGNLTYKAEIIEGQAKGPFTESSLFIDGTSCPFCK